eukprot:TRINITY_DN5784_c0_g1_i3.p2 TRINITY_DN5784_c0_g1~~TRINITY_DN5784_c0_g1_i3.p2  ORF type:complete len:937 (+),score=427.10 TRINITY_DN5784_c0_g1_i3:97-2811(+)
MATMLMAAQPVLREGGSTMFSETTTTILCIVLPIIGGLFAIFSRNAVAKIVVDPDDEKCKYHKSKITHGTFDDGHMDPNFKPAEHLAEIHSIQQKIAKGAKQFLFSEYQIIAAFSAAFALLIFVLISLSDSEFGSPMQNAAFSVLAFLIGAFASCLSGWIGMMIAVYTNGRTSFEAAWPGNPDLKYERSFKTAFQGGLVMGFGLTSVGMLFLFGTVLVFRFILNGNCEGTGFSDLKFANMELCQQREYIRLFECVAAFGLGGSSMAAFGRVGGGIFTKAADVGADLCGKVVAGLPEDDKRNPGVIADCIGDNVGDIAGMGSDLFGSFGEATCAALVVSAYGSQLSWESLMFPVMVTGFGMVSCMITAFCVLLGLPGCKVVNRETVEPVLKNQLIISTVLTTGAMWVCSTMALPSTFHVAKLVAASGTDQANGAYETVEVASWQAFLCIAVGLWAGLLIGIMTERYTSNRFVHVRGMADSCAKGGAATNVISGLAVGYNSCIVPCFAMAATVYVSFNLCLMYGVALAALGVLSTMSIGLTIDAYGPIADNAGGIVEMAELDSSIRTVTDDLDAAGNTTAAIGKGFAISSAAFVALALYGAFVTHCGIPSVNIVDSRTFPGLLVGAMLPYWFSGMTMTSVNKAAMEMVMEIKRQFEDPRLLKGEVEADHGQCVAVATKASLYEMIAPAGLVMLSPIICGVFFGKEALAGLLPGATISGVEMAISMSNTGGAWDNAKKYIEGGQMVVDAKGRPLSDVVLAIKAGKDEDVLPLHVVRKKKGWTALSGHSNDEGHGVDKLPAWKQEQLEEVRRIRASWGSYTAEQAAEPGGIRDIDHEIHSSAVIGDTVGDPLKDTSGPALNILVKLMAIISVVFVPVVNSQLGGLIFNRALGDFTQCASVSGNGCVQS